MIFPERDEDISEEEGGGDQLGQQRPEGVRHLRRRRQVRGRQRHRHRFVFQDIGPFFLGGGGGGGIEVSGRFSDGRS